MTEEHLNGAMALAESISVARQLEMISNDFTRLREIHSESITVNVEIKNKFIDINIGHSRTYKVDRKTGDVFAFPKSYRGTIAQVISNQKRLQQNYTEYIKRKGKSSRLSEVSPIVNLQKKSRPVFVAIDKIFVATWGYGMTLPEFVKVIDETPKTATVIKLEGVRHSDGGLNQGSGVETPGKPIGRPFRLNKAIDNYVGKNNMMLRGADKHDGKNSGSMHNWYEWDGTPQSYNTYD
jgi:hypothetical protein